MRPSYRPPLVPDTLTLIPAEDPGAEHSPMLRLALLVRAWHDRSDLGQGQIWFLSRPSRPSRPPAQTDTYPHTPFPAEPSPPLLCSAMLLVR